MNRIILVLISSAALVGLVAWGGRPGRHVPDWLYLLAAAPLAWVRIFGGREETSAVSEAKQGFGLLYLLGASIFLMVIGVVGRAMRGTWAEILAPALPFGGVVFLVSVLAMVFRSRN